MENNSLHRTEKAILKLLFQQRVPLTIYEISKDINISYPTVKKYIKNLEKGNYIKRRKGGYVNGKSKKESKKRKN